MTDSLHGRDGGRIAPSYQEYLDHDSIPVPRVLREQSVRDFGAAPLDASRYTSQGFFELEAERLWPRVWQMVCREEEIAEPGQTCVYDIAGRSFLVARCDDGSIKAFYNSCLHRGRKLMAESGRVERFRCPFHGFTWDLSGCVHSVPCRWDFEHLSDEQLRLPEAVVGTWGGFVFINPDPKAMPLERYLEVLPEHFRRWRLEDCWKAAHVAHVVRCNWKVAMEAFMETYHVFATHPRVQPVVADTNSQYDVYGDHVNRNLVALAAPSPYFARGTISDAQLVDGVVELLGRRHSAGAREFPAGAKTARQALGAANRQKFAEAFGGDYSAVTDAETLDAIVYNVFPNFSPWGGFAPNVVYRWRPHGRDVGACVMDVMILKRLAAGATRPQPVPMRWLREDEPWSAAAELRSLGTLLDEDMEQLPLVQEGLLASGTGEVHLGNYQEMRIRHFHRTLDKYRAGGR